MKILRILSFAAGMAFLLSGCTGAVGPAGPQGDPGINGTNGTNGANGANGVANINITIIDVFSSSWTTASNYEYSANSDTAIHSNTNNVVIASVSGTSGTGPWQALPASDVFAPSGGDQLNFNWQAGQITFYYEYSTFAYVPYHIWVNVAVIPPAVYKKYPNVNFKDANQVMQLPEWKAAMKVAKYQGASAQTTSSVKN
jgi:hypothetical protein